MAGIACSASRVAPKTSGSAISAIIAPAVRNERPKTAPPSAVNERKPKSACLEDAAARRSRARCSGVPGDDLDARLDRARQPGGPAVLDEPDRGARRRAAAAISVPMTVSRIVPMIGSRKPPVLRLVEVGLRVVEQQVEVEVLEPAHEHVDHDRAGDQAQHDAGRPAEREPDPVDPAPVAARAAWRAVRGRAARLLRAPGASIRP